MELPFDLTDILFITTANTLDTIPRPLLDRMEVIELTSYTDEEKLQIAKRYLLPRQMKEHGLKRPSCACRTTPSGRSSPAIPENPAFDCWSGSWARCAARPPCVWWTVGRSG